MLKSVATFQSPRTEGFMPSSKPITLQPSELRELWVLGVLGDTAYVLFALRSDNAALPKEKRGDSFDLDVGEFCKDWQVAPADDPRPAGKGKILSEKNCLKAIATIQEQGLLGVKPYQLSLQLY